MADPIAQTFDPRNPDANRRRLIDPRSLLLPHSITPDLLSDALFAPTTPDQAPGYHADPDRQAQENGTSPTVARSDHTHELTYLRVGSDRTKGSDDADYVTPFSNVVGSEAPPFDRRSRRIVTWDFDPNYPLPSIPAQVWARYSIDAGVTWTTWEPVGVVPPRTDELTYDADYAYAFDGVTVIDEYRILLPGYDRTAALKLTRTGADGKLDAGFIPLEVVPLGYSDGSIPGGNTIANQLGPTAFASSYTIPANDLAVGDVVEIELRGEYSIAIATTPTLQIDIRLGGVFIANTGAVTTILATINQSGWVFRARAVMSAVGATGFANAGGDVMFSSTVAASIAFAVTPIPTAGIDTTAALAIDAQVTWGAAAGGNTITLHTMTVKRYRT